MHLLLREDLLECSNNLVDDYFMEDLHGRTHASEQMEVLRVVTHSHHLTATFSVDDTNTSSLVRTW